MGKSKKNKKRNTPKVTAVYVDPRQQIIKLIIIKRYNPVPAKDLSIEFAKLGLMMSDVEKFPNTEDLMNSASSQPSGILATSSSLLLGDPSLWNKIDEYALGNETDTIQWVICCSNDRPGDDADPVLQEAWRREPGAQIAGNKYPWRKQFLLYRINKTSRQYLEIDKEMIPSIEFVSASKASGICASDVLPGWSLWLNSDTSNIEEGSLQRCHRTSCNNNSPENWRNIVMLCQCKKRTYCSMDCRNLDPHGCSPPLPTECSICCDDLLTPGTEQLLVMCQHCSNQFHKACISPWLKGEGTCPLCRMNWYNT